MSNKHQNHNIKQTTVVVSTHGKLTASSFPGTQKSEIFVTVNRAQRLADTSQPSTCLMSDV